MGKLRTSKLRTSRLRTSKLHLGMLSRSIVCKVMLIVLAVSIFLMTGCKRTESGNLPEISPETDRLNVVTTIFPYYDFVRQVAGDRVTLKLMVPAGMDSHSFEPTPADMIALQEADILICNGGAMEQWVQKVLDSLDTSSMKVLTMMDYVDVLEEEHVEGMEEEHQGHDHDEEPEAVHDHDEASEAVYDHDEVPEAVHDVSELEEVHEVFDREDGHEMEIEYDEHIWTSPVNAMTIVKIISQTLMEAAPEEAARFETGRDLYLQQLSEVDQSFRKAVAGGNHRMIVVADKFPFRYLAEEYGLSYRAAFSGCSTDTEPSAKTIAYLIDQIRDRDIGAVYYLELSSHRTADIICEETGAEPLLLHSCHNVTRREFDGGVTYLQLMEGNAERLSRGLQ